MTVKTAIASEQLARPGREGNFVPRTHRRDRYDQCGGIRQKGNLSPLRTRVWAGTSPSPLNPTNDRKGMRLSYSSDDGTGNRLSIGSVGTTIARGIYKKGNIFPLRTTVQPGPPPVPPLFPPHNHRWGFTRTGRSRLNRCAQGENVALFVYPPRDGRTDRSDAQTISGPIIRTIARPHPLPVIGGIERGRGGSGPDPCAQREKVSLLPYPPALVVPVPPMRAWNKVSLAPWSC